MEENRNNHLEEVVHFLRSEKGCPWDRAQTFESLRSCMLEEAYEYLAAVRIYEQTKNAENMREELGDLLLQVVMNSVIAQEMGLFDLHQVEKEVCEKMIRRHPHIFSGQSEGNDDGSQKSWDEIKKQEKEGKEWIVSPLREIPAQHPALLRAPKVLKKVDKLYEPCQNESGTFAEMEKTLSKLKAAQEEDRGEILGDLLMEICNLARLWKLPLELTMQDRIEELIERYEPINGQIDEISR